jgi:hypothetical protein
MGLDLLNWHMRLPVCVAVGLSRRPPEGLTNPLSDALFYTKADMTQSGAYDADRASRTSAYGSSAVILSVS